ncbi:MAG: cellulase family glycosylhydrolase [Hyphomicrobium sp.]
MKQPGTLFRPFMHPVRAMLSFVCWLALSIAVAYAGGGAQEFVKRQGTGFVLNGAPFTVAGINNHYLTFGSPQEVVRVLDDAAAMHANVVRTFIQPVIGSPQGAPMPTIWDWNSTSDSSDMGAKGVYLIYWDASRQRMAFNEGRDGFIRLDFLVAEARKRNLKLLIAFLDFWDYAGGAQQMRTWYGSDDPNTFFFSDPRCLEDYRTLVSYVLNRKNTITGTVYKDDPTIFAWELMNEPNVKTGKLLISWVSDMAAHVKSIDPNHLVGTGYGHEQMADISVPSVDFGAWHGYPLYFNITNEKFATMIGEFCEIGKRASKPVLLEEFGLARSHADQAGVYAKWLAAVRENADCAGWLVWRLVSRQDSGSFPTDQHDQFDIHNDGGPAWTVLQKEAILMRSRSAAPPP